MKNTTTLIILAAIGIAGYFIWKKTQESQTVAAIDQSNLVSQEDASVAQPDLVNTNTPAALELAGINQVQIQIQGVTGMQLTSADDNTASILAKETISGLPSAAVKYATDQDYAPYKQGPTMTKVLMTIMPYAGAIGDPYKLPLPPRTDAEIYADIAADPLQRATAEQVAKGLPAVKAQGDAMMNSINQMVKLTWDMYGQGTKGVPIPSYFNASSVLGMTGGQSGGNFSLGL